MNVEDFIQQHENTSIAELSLILSKKPEYPAQFIINQVNGHTVAALQTFQAVLQGFPAAARRWW